MKHLTKLVLHSSFKLLYNAHVIEYRLHFAIPLYRYCNMAVTGLAHFVGQKNEKLGPNSVSYPWQRDATCLCGKCAICMVE
jgi:hypothetical protein